jgi:hypothetical protein
MTTLRDLGGFLRWIAPPLLVASVSVAATIAVFWGIGALWGPKAQVVAGAVVYSVRSGSGGSGKEKTK